MHKSVKKIVLDSQPLTDSEIPWVAALQAAQIGVMADRVLDFECCILSVLEFLYTYNTL